MSNAAPTTPDESNRVGDKIKTDEERNRELSDKLRDIGPGIQALLEKTKGEQSPEASFAVLKEINALLTAHGLEGVYTNPGIKWNEYAAVQGLGLRTACLYLDSTEKTGDLNTKISIAGKAHEALNAIHLGMSVHVSNEDEKKKVGEGGNRIASQILDSVKEAVKSGDRYECFQAYMTVFGYFKVLFPLSRQPDAELAKKHKDVVSAYGEMLLDLILNGKGGVATEVLRDYGRLKLVSGFEASELGLIQKEGAATRKMAGL